MLAKCGNQVVTGIAGCSAGAMIDQLTAALPNRESNSRRTWIAM
jgi:predicted acylesterase/phospholipase RssA